MYPVSDKFMEAVQKNTRTFYWTGSIVTKNHQTYSFGNEDIVKGSGYITRQCCGSTEIELGTVYASEMGISLYSDVDRYPLDGGEIGYRSIWRMRTVRKKKFLWECSRSVKPTELSVAWN